MLCPFALGSRHIPTDSGSKTTGRLRRFAGSRRLPPHTGKPFDESPHLRRDEATYPPRNAFYPAFSPTGPIRMRLMQKTYRTPATRRFTTGKDRSSHRFPVSLRPHRSVARRFGLTSKPGPFVRLSVFCPRRPYLRGKRRCGPDRSGEDLREAQTHLSPSGRPFHPARRNTRAAHAALRYRSHRKSMALSMARQHTGQKRSPLRMQHASAGR